MNKKTFTNKWNTMFSILQYFAKLNTTTVYNRFIETTYFNKYIQEQ